MSQSDNVARTAVSFPIARVEYEVGDEQQFRLALEQEVQRLYGYIAELLTRVEALEP